jgi:beta-glucosidase
MTSGGAVNMKGFARVLLEPGETGRLTVELERRSFPYYDTDLGEWVVTPGVFEVLVGRSSQVIELSRKLTFTK